MKRTERKEKKVEFYKNFSQLRQQLLLFSDEVPEGRGLVRVFNEMILKAGPQGGEISMMPITAGIQECVKEGSPEGRLPISLEGGLQSPATLSEFHFHVLSK